MKTTYLTTPAHECESANTYSGTLTVDAIDITITAFDRTPRSQRKVEELLTAIAAILNAGQF